MKIKEFIEEIEKYKEYEGRIFINGIMFQDTKIKAVKIDEELTAIKIEKNKEEIARFTMIKGIQEEKEYREVEKNNLGLNITF